MASKISADEYRGLAELRYRIRLFLKEGDAAALKAGLEPKQYLLLLAVRGISEYEEATIGMLAERLAIKHHSAVELVDRLEKRGFVKRVRGREDRRQVKVALLPRGEKVLARVVEDRISELRASGAALARAIESLLRGKKRSARRSG